MLIVDSHLHFDEKVDGTALGAARELDRQLAQAGVARAIALHLETQPWSMEEFSQAVAATHRIKAFVNLHPDRFDVVAQLRSAIENFGYIGLKLHPRLQEFAVDSPSTIRLVQEAGDMDIPVLIDAFPDGTHLMQGFHPLRYASLARQCPQTRIIWAHMGGHYVLDFMMLAKRLPNVYLDTVNILSANTNTDGTPAIRILANASGAAGTVSALAFYGTGPHNIIASGSGGGIELSSSTRSGGTSIGFSSATMNILANGGDIILRDNSYGTNSVHTVPFLGTRTTAPVEHSLIYFHGAVTIGSKAGTAVTSSSSNIYHVFDNGTQIGTVKTVGSAHREQGLI
jgi:hypothetical protein